MRRLSFVVGCLSFEQSPVVSTYGICYSEILYPEILFPFDMMDMDLAVVVIGLTAT